MARIGGRKAGTPNIAPLDKIKANENKFLKDLYEKAMRGDTVAQAECIRIIREEEERAERSRGRRKKATTAVSSNTPAA